MRIRCAGVRFKNKTSLFYRMSANITLSKRKLMLGCALFFRKKLFFNNTLLLGYKYEVSWVSERLSTRLFIHYSGLV